MYGIDAGVDTLLDYLLLLLCSVDATEDDHRYGRMINHSKKSLNAKPKVVSVDGLPRVRLVSTRAIDKGEEVLYDYGERRRDVIDSNPWLIL